MRHLAVLLLTTALSVPAYANSYTITDMEIGGGSPYTTVNVGAITPSAPNAIAGVVLLSVPGTVQQIPVFCVDLFHDFTIGPQSPFLKYTEAPIMTDSSGMFSGQGKPLSTEQLREMQAIANLGTYQWFEGGVPGIVNVMIGDQAAIWSIEYGEPVTSTSPIITGDINDALQYAIENPAFGKGPTLGLYQVGTDGHFGDSQGFIEGRLPVAPETSTWMMMLLGFLGLGGIARRRAVRVQL